METLLSLPEASERLQVSRWHLYKLVADREIPFMRVGRKAIRFQPAALEEWIKERTVAAEARTPPAARRQVGRRTISA